MIVVHDLHVPATATAIDHLCIGENAITAIDVERAPGGDGRAALVGRLMRETEILAAVLGPVGVDAERIRGGVCRLGRLPVPRSGRTGAIAVCDARGAAKLARRARRGAPDRRADGARGGPPQARPRGPAIAPDHPSGRLLIDA